MNTSLTKVRSRSGEGSELDLDGREYELDQVSTKGGLLRRPNRLSCWGGAVETRVSLLRPAPLQRLPLLQAFDFDFMVLSCMLSCTRDTCNTTTNDACSILRVNVVLSAYGTDTTSATVVRPVVPYRKRQLSFGAWSTTLTRNAPICTLQNDR